jgi:hypothetical protein
MEQLKEYINNDYDILCLKKVITVIKKSVYFKNYDKDINTKHDILDPSDQKICRFTEDKHIIINIEKYIENPHIYDFHKKYLKKIMELTKYVYTISDMAANKAAYSTEEYNIWLYIYTHGVSDIIEDVEYYINYMKNYSLYHVIAVEFLLKNYVYILLIVLALCLLYYLINLVYKDLFPEESESKEAQNPSEDKQQTNMKFPNLEDGILEERVSVNEKN